MPFIDRDNPHTSESTTHWACDGSLVEGGLCCGCNKHNCMPEQKPSERIDKIFIEYKSEGLSLVTGRIFNEIRNILDEHETRLRQLEQERKEGV